MPGFWCHLLHLLLKGQNSGRLLVDFLFAPKFLCPVVFSTMAERRHLLLCLTPDRESDILGFILHSQIEDEVTVVYSGRPHSDHQEADQEAPVDGGQAEPADEGEHQPPLAVAGIEDQPPVAVADQEDQPPQAAALIPQEEGEAECHYCFCRPCITSPEPMWLREQAACPENAAIRRKMYKNFWGVMSNLMPSPWHDPRYLARKQARMAQDAALAPARRRLVMAGSVREVMPKCVLRLVRRKYPNPPGVPYMGHRWL